MLISMTIAKSAIVRMEVKASERPLKKKCSRRRRSIRRLLIA